MSTPRPTPGKIKALLHWPMTCFFPSYLTGSKGEPVATSARPSECCKASEGVHSALLVGLLRGKMMGRSQWSAIARMASGVKSPGCPVVPIRTVSKWTKTKNRCTDYLILVLKVISWDWFCLAWLDLLRTHSLLITPWLYSNSALKYVFTH